MEANAQAQDDDKTRRLKEIALREPFFAPYKRSTIFALVIGDDLPTLYEYKRLFGGSVMPYYRGGGDQRSGENMARGQYEWHIEGEECYKFCRDVLPYLLPRWYGSCLKCIERYEREANSNQ